MIGVDVRPVEDEAEGLALMLHHLRLAAAYFEASPEDLMAHLHAPGDDFSRPAMIAWAVAMEALYPDDGG